MDKRQLDCVIVGFNDTDLQGVMEVRRKMTATSGAYRQMLGSVFRHGGKWLHHVQFLNAVLQEATGREHRLHTMELANLAVCYLASYLKRRDFDVDIINFFNSGRDRLEALLATRPRTVAISTTLYVEGTPVTEIVDFVRRRSPETLLVVGGPHILTLCSNPHVLAQETLLQRMGADIYVHEAQGELTLARLLTELRKDSERDLTRIPNLICRPGLEVCPADPGKTPAKGFLRTPREIEFNDMDAEATNWSLLPRELYSPTATLVLSRSCPFRCSFCRYPALAGSFKTVNVDTVRREMRQFRDAGVTTLILFDDTPNVPLPRFKAMMTMMIEEDFQFRWFSNLRCTNMDAEAYDLMGRSGCRGVFLGIESGDQRILDNMNKQARIDAYRDGMRRLHELGILTYTSFIVGFPGETAETLENTIRFIEEARPDYYQVHVYYHSKSVPLQEQASRFGLQGSDYSWTHNSMTWQDACDAADLVRRRITHSIVGTSYLSTFWMIGYLLGKGVTMEHIRNFMALCAPLLIHNAETWATTPAEPPLSPELLAVARRMAEDMDRREDASEKVTI